MTEIVIGGANTLSKMRGRFPGVYPRSLVSGSGSIVTDDQEREYIDWIAGLGAVSLGYGDAEVNARVRFQVGQGPIFSLPDVELEERVAQRLVDLIPCAESVRFLKTGSECTEAAIRVARAATGRDVVLTCGYHGWHSWYAATREYCPGVPIGMKGLARSFRYNDLDSLDLFLRGGCYFADDIAAIILEPTLIEPPAPEFLEGVRERATRIGAVLIFDEMVTGFHWNAGGYQTLCGVTPDLATFGKGMGNGYPMAALVGRADLMRHAMLVSGTFGGDCIGLAAADATLARYQQGGVCEHMWAIGSRLIDGYNAAATRTFMTFESVPTRMIGQPPHPVIRWEEGDGSYIVPGVESIAGGPAYNLPILNRHRASLFFQETVKRGILFHPDGLNIMLAHSDQDVTQTLAACEEAMGIVAKAIALGTVREQIEGEPIDPRPAWRVTQ